MTSDIFRYGAQYYRPPNPPESQWERDFQNYSNFDFNIMKIWALWTHTNPAPGEYDFSELEKLCDLAMENGIKVVINTIIEDAPYWLEARHPESRYMDQEGTAIQLMARPNKPGGGWPGLCLDNDPVRAQAAEFLEKIGSRFRGHEALWGFDCWNEAFNEAPNFRSTDSIVCYCDASIGKFRNWLIEKYREIETLNQAWSRKYSDWEQVLPPRWRGGYPDWLDWMKFRLDNQVEQMEWRVKAIRRGAPDHPVMSHGLVPPFHNLPVYCNDNQRLAGHVDLWGCSLFPGNTTDFKMFLGLDHARSTAGGKDFWVSELQGGPACDGLRRSPMLRAERIRSWNWIALISGAKGLIYWQYRPELLGLESPGYGLCNLDGSPSERTDIAGKIAGLIRDKIGEKLIGAEYIPGDLAILDLPTSQLFCYCQTGSAELYHEDIAGIYKVLWEENFRVDFTDLENMKNYKAVYLPFPLLLEKETVKALSAYVEGGGVLISEACPGHYRDLGYAEMKVPGSGLDQVFGAVEIEAEYIPPDTADLPIIDYKTFQIHCLLYQERLQATHAKVWGKHSDMGAAVTVNEFGDGKAVLIGTMLGLVVNRELEFVKNFLVDILNRLGVKRLVSVPHPDVKARLFKSEDGYMLGVANCGHHDVNTYVSFSKDLEHFKHGLNLSTGKKTKIIGHSLRVRLKSLDGALFIMS